MTPDPMKPMENDADSPSVVAPDALHPETGATLTDGVAPASHPELRAEHPDAAKLRVAAAETDGTYSDARHAGHDGSATDTLAAQAPAAFWSSTKLATGEE